MSREQQLEAALRLARDLLDPECLGHAVTPEIRDRARIVLGIEPCEFKSPVRDAGPAIFGGRKTRRD